jgi:FkbM family methyltransferase
MSRLRGFVYWLLTVGPLGMAVGWFFRDRCFDRYGAVALPETATPDIAGAIIFEVYEYPERKLIHRWLPSDVDCIELGCSIGIISRVILQKLEPTKRLVAVEASKSLVELSKANVAAAGYSSRFEVIHGAVHYQGDYVNFAEHGEHIRGKVTVAEEISANPISCVALADVLKRSDIGLFSLVMDIEGSEFDVIANDFESLSNCQVIVVEVHGDKTKTRSFISALKDGGFGLVDAKHSVFVFSRYLHENQ